MEFFLRDIDADSGDRASWRAIGHLNTTRTELREVLTLADSAIGMASRAEMAEVAPVIWNEIRTSLERILVMTGQQMDDNIIRGQETPTEPQRTITCQICQDALPTIARSGDWGFDLRDIRTTPITRGFRSSTMIGDVRQCSDRGQGLRVDRTQSVCDITPPLTQNLDNVKIHKQISS
ncbi:uncharacterized protein LOC129005145 [Macrosteles quadrilineatus]|uniref:uncharacterized protein LOC129005145 n=1 Tax=Macrosteles quadrilineatus TaxID=74068 RepID=UPI0023E1381C|nr:uncharacterized protein LOC129005145 [Macrosteles quadrilineatus]